MKSNHGFKSEIVVKNVRLRLEFEQEVRFTEIDSVIRDLKASGKYKAIRQWTKRWPAPYGHQFFVLAFA